MTAVLAPFHQSTGNSCLFPCCVKSCLFSGGARIAVVPDTCSVVLPGGSGVSCLGEVVVGVRVGLGVKVWVWA